MGKPKFSHVFLPHGRNYMMSHRQGKSLSSPVSFCKIYLQIIACTFVLYSCSSLQAGVYLSSVDKMDKENILKNEMVVKTILEKMLIGPEYYTLKAYERTGINFQFRRTNLIVHSFYVIINQDGEYHTLSFYGTEIAFYSEGAWIIDSDADAQAYAMFLEGKNNWDVAEIRTENDINVQETIRNIVKRIESDVTYYYKDHIKNKPNMDNCNTALHETLVEQRNRKFAPAYPIPAASWDSNPYVLQ
jgi:hypothetical protein